MKSQTGMLGYFGGDRSQQDHTGTPQRLFVLLWGQMEDIKTFQVMAINFPDTLWDPSIS